MQHSKFKLSYFLHPGESYHVARVNITSSQDLSLHSHDYAELLWIEKGSGYHLVNGQRLKLTAGDMVMMRPHDIHTYSPIGKGFTLINIAFPADTLDYFRSRYFPGSGLYFWTQSVMPFRMKLSPRIITRISSRTEEAIANVRSNLQLDSLLLFIFRQITANEKITAPSDIPEWLFGAVHQYNISSRFEEGTKSFVELCGRNSDYVNRMVKQHFGLSTIEMVNRSKMQYAANQLSITSMPIKEICLNCGFANLGHFYRVFRKIYDQTPRQYRKINQTIV